MEPRPRGHRFIAKGEPDMTPILALALALCSFAQDDKPWLVFEGGEGAGKGKHIVLLSGDEEYRSEEAMPQLGRLLSKQQGFKCTVLFSVNKQTGEIDPKTADNEPGMEGDAKRRFGHHEFAFSEVAG